MYKKILVPVDGSSASMQGLREAVRFAKDQKARLRIMHVVDETVLAQYPEALDATGQLLATFIDDGKKTLNDAVTLAKRQGIKAEYVLYNKLLGALSDLILREAKKWQAATILLGTEAKRGVRNFFFCPAR